MSYSSMRKPKYNMKKIYNKWRLGSLGLDLAGLVLFFFALGMAAWRIPLLAISAVLLWAAVIVARKYVQIEKGKPFEAVAQISYFISVVLAIILSVLSVITIING